MREAYYHKTKTYNYKGAVHIHTVFSDGSGDVDKITKAAKASGLDWILITDHNNMDVSEGIINGVYVVKGEEISPVDANHYLALDIKNVIKPDVDIKKTVEAVSKQGGFGFAAHPDESLSRNNNHKPLRWTDKNVIPDGVEIWNWFSQWGDNYSDENFLKIVHSYFFKDKYVTKPYKETLKWWDELNDKSENIVPAIGGVDAHGMLVKKYLVPVVIFPYKYMFKTIVNEINLLQPLSKNFEEARAQILSALKLGHNIIINSQNCEKNPDIFVKNHNEIVSSGRTILLDSETCLIVKCYKKFKISVLKNGVEIESVNAKELQLPLTDSGKYRVEIEVREWGAVYSNPIIVKRHNFE